jgi:hypothetical protein
MDSIEGYAECELCVDTIAGGEGVTFTYRLSGHVLRCHINEYKIRICVPLIRS